MIIYVTFGGMIATTWVQIIKAGLLLGGATLMALLVLAHFSFDPGALFAKAVEVHPRHGAIMSPIFAPSGADADADLGDLARPGADVRHRRPAAHPDALLHRRQRQGGAQVGVLGTGFIGYFYILTFIIGFGAIVFVGHQSDFIYQARSRPTRASSRRLKGGANMPAIYLAQGARRRSALRLHRGGRLRDDPRGGLGPDAGRRVARSATTSTPTCSRRGKVDGGRRDAGVEDRHGRCLGIFAILLGVAFERINVAFMVGLAFAIAASCNFPVLLMSMFWKGLTTWGAVVGGFVGLITAMLGVILSPAVWEGIFGNPKGSALVTIDNPTIVSMTLAFVAIYVVSKLDTSARAATDRAGFAMQFVRSQTGVGAEGASAH